MNIDSDYLVKIIAKVAKYVKRGSAWYCSSAAEALVLDAIKLSGGGNTSSRLAALQAPTFLGYPILSVVDMPDSPTANYSGEVMIAFGNLRMAAVLGNRRGTRAQLSHQVY